ncbi:hypothetical protein HYU21_02790 [Candidatus Woesearchaeota archaeon]|nr:hypothetical protein [Candidatus Woesearchaeota archaeon]
MDKHFFHHPRNDMENGPLDKPITIKITPRKVIKSVLILGVLLAVFFLGRVTADPDSDSIDWPSFNFTGMFAGDNDDADVEKVSATKSKVTDDNAADEDTSDTSTTTASNTADTSDSAADTSNTAADNTVTTADADTPTAEVDDTEYITKYTKVSIALTSVRKEWKTTWGKITDVVITIKNGEEGPIKMDHLIMEVEGYPDFEKKIPLPLSLQKIVASKTLSTSVRIPQGFAYNEGSVGDLNSVDITLTLVDTNGKEVSKVTAGISLKG